MTAFRRCATLAALLLPALLSATEKNTLPIPPDSAQLIVVSAVDWQAPSGTLQRFERVEGRWEPIDAPFPVVIGKNGAAWGLGLHPPVSDGPRKVEGDGKAPAGVFALGTAFGYAPALETKLGYAAMNDTDWCVDVNESPLYNRIVSTRDVGIGAVDGSTEPMRRDLHLGGDSVYKKGFIIKHNPDNMAKAGSCIFAHLWRSPGAATAGCTAMPEADMDRLLAWLDAGKNPVFVLLPAAEYSRLRKPWQLPKFKD
jgi:L,D-peptidoglycan transpeptidase YkuD (ErfK/YbiS/YcfS/YnhG family)